MSEPGRGDGAIESTTAPTAPVGTRADAITILAVLALVALVGAAPTLRRWFGARATRAQCESLVDRWAEHVAFAQDPDASKAELERKRRVVLGEAPPAPSSASVDDAVASPPRTARFEPRSSRVERCTREVLDAEATCALAAGGLDEFERCMR